MLLKLFNQGIESEIPHIQNQPLEPNIETKIPSTQSLKRKEPMITERVEGETADLAANKESIMGEPVALPHPKKSRIQIEASQTPCIFPNDAMVEKEKKTVTSSFSQQSESIEIHQLAMTSERVSSPHTQKNLIAQGEAKHTQEELTETEGSTILRLETPDIDPLKDAFVRRGCLCDCHS